MYLSLSRRRDIIWPREARNMGTAANPNPVAISIWVFLTSFRER
ncbi:MAG: hypothetical protein NWE86_02980 [Candidatus Bathyarchaeota archaeon]|nr:hypothetical protein [Candidatus Bathyarchaeota archaeon]